ncbi:MAG: hypothetical protein KC636_31905, partial [Myxococcales bacterium]|nr:hypothetical protein [Myxococcales bacterium]
MRLCSPVRATWRWLALAVPLTLGCSVSKIVDRATVKTVTPGVLRVGDVGMACAVGETATPLSLALGVGEDEPRRAAAVSFLSAGMCSELAAWEAELDRRQALYISGHGGDGALWSTLARDAHERERRLHQEAARRNALAYERVVAQYGAPTADQTCPKKRLKEPDQLVFLLGLTAGLLAVLHDGAAERSMGVSLAIPRDVERGATCLDDQRYWRVPTALRAAVWTSVPGAAPSGQDPWAMLHEAAAHGERRGVWLARALEVQAAGAAGRDELLRAAIEEHARAAARGPGDPDLALLNSFAAGIIRHESDRIWMNATGHRTPLVALGTFPG